MTTKIKKDKESLLKCPCCAGSLIYKRYFRVDDDTEYRFACQGECKSTYSHDALNSALNLVKIQNEN